MKVMVDDGSYYFYLSLQCSLATMITQPTPNTGHVGYKSLHVVHCMTHSMSYSVAIEHHCDSDVVEMMHPRESKLRWSMRALG